MGWRLPPLNALRAFEVAARHSSFTRASDELFVTPGAVSRQVRGLEDYLGRPLFDRNYREVVPTERSKIFAAELFESFARMDRASRAFVASEERHQLRIYAPNTFALRWLLPRLRRYHASFPDQEISIESLKKPPMDLEKAQIDVAFRLAGSSPNTIALPLFDIKLIPVCSPAYLAANPVKHPRDMLKLNLLRSLPRAGDWQTWCEKMRIKNLDGIQILPFESSALAYQAAIAGLGVAIAQRPFVEDDLASGRLVAPFPTTVSDGATFHVVYSTPSKTNEAVQGFVGWVQDEIARDIDTHAAS